MSGQIANRLKIAVVICCFAIAIFFVGCDAQNIEMMPVFRNPLHMLPAEFAQHEGLSANALSDEEMAEIAENIIVAMGFEATSVGIADMHDIIWARGVTATAEGVKVTVELHGFVQVVFENGFPLPDGMILSWEYHHQEAIAYLTERFAPILGVEHIAVGDNSGDIVAQILDYHFNGLRFIPNSDGQLGRINRFAPSSIVLREQIGYFPIISPDEAIERMLDGQGSFGVDMGQTRPTADEVIDIRLVYFGHSLGRNFLEAFAPWYELTVQTADTPHLQSYFVPAIQSDYLEANPAWSVYPHQ
ncbi:MAG: hypothetical protein FWB91_10035 [Defluviitaleaceae bacterium]|nr:hypothetical protein [Defluviitaleaceae bacterium]